MSGVGCGHYNISNHLNSHQSVLSSQAGLENEIFLQRSQYLPRIHGGKKWVYSNKVWQSLQIISGSII